ncbi:FdhF/YdeP family oxidoreductase [Aeoliella sp. ICT_H6.2]|uniref:FdhF/YdeP family oxidoreductase n=1 Tax=Aeoliella straminimaris TaxID=2954799 RepID=A0A9X2FFX8_9BACT|nr:FdhF/YdeP family oxidoreductase [Aeoliella straminimaris]MCO6047302.1 FdhF/YdeP family oxidoreductase [Aeoliella straminimaris]
MKKVKTGGGWPAIVYSLRKAREAGGLWKFWKAMRSRNACKTCALGMGGQRGGMVNEIGSFPEVCKKSMQAMVADMQGAIQPEFFERYSVSHLKGFTPRELESCGRLVDPLLYSAETGRYHTITWDQAYNHIADKLASLAADETFWYFSGRSSNEAGFLLQLFARVYGTNNVNNCSYYCHQASGVGLSSVTGSGTATIVLEDLDKADLVFVIGGNPASNHPRLIEKLMHLRRRGGKVIVVNPIVETGMVNFSVPSNLMSLLFGTEIASQYVQPHIGGDLAMLYGIAKRVLELDAHDQAFLDEHCEQWPELRQQLESLSWDEIVAKSGVAESDIFQMANTYAEAKNVVFSWTMGITHHAHGVENVQAIANLALMRAMVGRPGAGLLPIRGHSNVQGIGSMGVTPKLKDAIFERLQQHFGVELPTTRGRDTMDCMEGAASGELKLGLCLGGNLYGSNPDAAFAEQALNNLDLVVYLSTTLNTGHAFGTARETIVLPVLARDEEPQPTTQESMFNYVRLSDGGPRRLEGPVSEVEVIATIARKTLERRNAQATSAIDWQSMQDTGRIRQAIAKIIPGFEAIENIQQTKEEFQIGGRTFHQPKFATTSGRANLHVHSLPELQGEASEQLRVMTIRSEGQFNTVVYEDYDLYRGIERRDVILLHPDDLAARGLTDGQLVKVAGPAGTMNGVRATAFTEIRAGNGAMYYPEANALVSRQLDPKSKTPAFKCVLVTVTADVPLADPRVAVHI